MLRLGPLRRSLLRRAPLAPRASVAAVTRSTESLLVQQSRGMHWANFPDTVPFSQTSYSRRFNVNDSRVAPSELVNASFAVVTQNELVVSRLGDELFAYGDFDASGDELDHDQVMNSMSLRDDCISHAQIEQDCWGPDRINASYTTSKIKYNIKGSKGRGVVFARVQDDQKNGQYVYLIVTFVETGETVEIIDNREELAV